MKTVRHKNCEMCTKKGVPPKYLLYGQNIGKLHITGKLIGQTCVTTYVRRISIDGGAPSGENMIFFKNGQTHIFAARGTRVVGNTSQHGLLHLCSNISP